MTKPSPAAPRQCEECGQTFLGGNHARWCPTCRPAQRRAKRTIWKLDAAGLALLRERYDSRVKNRVAEIARALGWPKWAVKKQAQRLGLARSVDRRNWTPAEITELEIWAGVRSAQWIARRLDRPALSVINKLKRMEISRKVREGYAVCDIARCFGVDHHIVDGWIRRGWLANGAVVAVDPKFVRYGEETLRKFIRHHPLEFRLDKVDQVWFLGLVLGIPIDEERLCRRGPDSPAGLIDQLRDAGLDAWDAVEDPEALVQEMRGG